MPVAEEYDDEEYTDATAAFFTAIKQLVSHSRSGIPAWSDHTLQHAVAVCSGTLKDLAKV